MGRVGVVGFYGMLITLTCLTFLGSAGCSEEAGTGTAWPGVSTTSSSALVVTSVEAQVLGEFVELGALMGSVPVFGLARLASGMTIAPTWWPVVEQNSPPEGDSGFANPHVVGDPSREPEGQLLLRCGDGWLNFIANFRGDLGDVSGEMVGSVAQRPAYLHQLNGGWLVQWSYEGRWYALFGRGVPRDVVTSTALNMTLIERY
jgi:hypothetical protein